MSQGKPNSDTSRLVDQLANSVDIEELAKRLGLSIKRNGGTASTLCIDHNEENPSMRLFPASNTDKPHYHCFVCGAHGDIFTLVQKVKNLDFIGAVKWLSSEYGLKHTTTISQHKISLPKRANQQPSKNQNYTAYEYALTIYKSNSSKSTTLIDWLENRELSKNIADSAEICLSTPNCLINQAANSANYGTSREILGELESTGLIRPLYADPTKDLATHLDVGAKYRDFFYDSRIIFPIRDMTNALLGFAARKLDDKNSSPKYLYTPGLPKGQILYRVREASFRLSQLSKAGKTPIIYICEGLIDALRLESFGLAAVAVLGSKASESQAKTIAQLAKTLPEITPLQVRIFLDKDAAGLKGASSTIKTLLTQDPDRRLELAFIWNNSKHALLGQNSKDPDELLKNITSAIAAKKLLEEITHPAAVALISDKLGILPEEILDDQKWENLPYGPKSRSISYLRTISDNEIARVTEYWRASKKSEPKWLSDISSYTRTPDSFTISERTVPTPNDLTIKLNHARELAQAGANKGEVLSDIATWRRLSLAATAFNEGIISRLKENNYKPTEPFDAVHVSRGFGRNEERLKAMPCPEDLILQQYIMNELLSEQLDGESSTRFSNHIPAVRYYRGEDTLRTTGESPGTEESETLSFAYQIDMDAIELRAPPKDGGMFRPYFECWQGFIASLLSQGRNMDNVHMVRLDLKRYYDNIKRSTVKNLLTSVITPAFESLEYQENFLPLFQPTKASDQRNNATIDFLLDHCFGFTYYHPDTGEPQKTNREMGIPQGPSLSAWIGNILLFKLDSALRKKLKELNSEGVVKAGYARYVDDVVILGDSLDIIDVLRALIEDITNSLGLEMISKESFAPMSSDEFEKHLISGRAIAASGPREEQTLFEAANGDAGWESWHTTEVNRQTSLELLRDNRLYSLPPETIENQIFTALRAKDLRPSELSKAARWMWYQAVIKTLDKSPENIFKEYWSTWKKVCNGAPFLFNSDLPWDDPALYAIEGLESLLERANNASFRLNPEEEQLRRSSISILAHAACSDDFIKLFTQSNNLDAPAGWACGTVKLRRMTFQRLISMQWKAALLSNHTTQVKNKPKLIIEKIESEDQVLQTSLKRALTTHMETWKLEFTELASTEYGNYSAKNSIAGAFAWLHKAIVQLSNSSNQVGGDPLDYLREELDEINKSPITDDKLIPILNALLIRNEQHEDSTPGEIIILSLQTLATISPREKLPNLLASRPHLLQKGESKLPLPPLPGVPANGLLLCSNAAADDWTKLSKIWWVTLSNDSLADSPPEFKISSPDKPALLYIPEWTQTKLGSLAIYEANWNAGANWALKAPTTFRVNSNNLRWVANTFEAIARLNYESTDDSPDNSREFAAAWPYLVVNSRPDKEEKEPLELSLLTPSYPSKLLDGAAYIKDGTRGLRTYDVPELYGHHWRAGVLLSELFGYRRDLDQFASLGADNVEHDANEVLSPADHLLRNILRKLRGSYARGALLKSYETAEHLPATIARSLNLLRNFPDDGEISQGIAFVLASESETAAMQVRLSHDLQLNQPGINCSFFERVAARVINQIPLSWSKELNKNIPKPTLNIQRSIPSFYYELSYKIQHLLSPSQYKQANNLSFKILVTGLKIASITSWLREVAFCIEFHGSEDAWPFPVNGDLAGDWQIEEQGFLFDSPESSISELSAFFTKNVKDSAPLQVFSDITPLGWLVIVAGRVGLFGKNSKRPLHKIISTPIQQQAKNLAVLLATPSTIELDPEGSVNPDWPFEKNHEEIANCWMELELNELTDFLAEIEKCLGLQVKKTIGSWRLDAGNGSFTDASGESWKLTRSQLSIGHGNKPERIEHGTRLLSVWDETSDQEGNLLFVAARGERFKKLSEITSEFESFETQTSLTNIDSKDLAIPPSLPPLLQHASSDNPTSNFDTPILPDSEEIVDSSGPSKPVLPPSLDSTFTSDPVHSWRDLQREAWALRKGRSPGHTRIAIMQWKVNETYHHPAIESGHLDQNWPTLQELRPMEKSKAEGRRRAFITEALSACEAFGVDILVLPEYSVRPDTVKWLREQLKRKPNHPAVLAGTYKLHGNSTDANFEKTHNTILGNSDHLKTFGQSNSNSSFDHSSSYMSGEHSAIMTLLAPLELTTGERIVCTFSRRKKYSSLAASEVFSPLIDPLRPLFSAENLIEEIGSRSVTDQRQTPTISLTPQTFLQYYNKLGALDNFAEFICSELFLPMSPVNYKALAAELHKLAVRFGASMSPERADKCLLEDLASMAEYLGISAPSGKRKSIILVPAMTTRSADYWIFGQATLLSGGATTVFCNAVLDKSSVGGSCFIGRNSWNKSKKSPIIDTITPYAGWSKGIYYNQSSDALGESEQAIVIADIDPSFMQEGRPRPQALAIPLQLVAYLPIVETDDTDTTSFNHTIEPVIANITKKSLLGRIVHPNDADFIALNKVLNEQLKKNHNPSFSERFNHWTKYWRVNPFAGTPPAIVDWIRISPTLDSDNPDIFMPLQN